MTKNICEKIVRPKPAALLLYLDRNIKNLQKAANESNLTHSHVLNLIKKWEQAGLVRYHKEGRTNHFQLTRRGKEIAESIAAIQNRLVT